METQSSDKVGAWRLDLTRKGLDQLVRLLQITYGYFLVRRGDLKKIRCRAGGHFLVEYDICRKLKPDTIRKTGRTYGKALKLSAEVNEHGRWDLSVRLKKVDGSNFHTRYHRIIGLAFCKSRFNKRGRKCSPFIVAAADYKDFEVDHTDWDNLNCRLSNLRVLPISRHRGEGRDAWNVKSLSNERRGRK